MEYNDGNNEDSNQMEDIDAILEIVMKNIKNRIGTTSFKSSLDRTKPKS